MRHRLFVPLGVAVLALAVVAPALAVRVHVRVEGPNATIFGATEPRVTPVTGTFTPPAGPAVTAAAATPLGALEAASRRADFYYRVESFGFGPYVAQVGRHGGTASTGWVYKVNGVSPPVSATAYELEEGDRVLWYHARFGPTGGPRTLRLVGVSSHAAGICYDATYEDDAGGTRDFASARFLLDGRRARGRLLGGSVRRICPTGHWHTLRAIAPGLVRSQVVVPRRRTGRPPTGGAGSPALAGRL